MGNSELDHDQLISDLQGEKNSPVAKAMCRLLLDHKELKDAVCGNKKYQTKGLVERMYRAEKCYTYLTVVLSISILLGAAASKDILMLAVKFLLH